MNNSSDNCSTASDSEEATNITCSSLLAEKSKKRYEMIYDVFKKWCEMTELKYITERVVLAYFQKRSEALKSPASLWCEYSMLKAMILSKDKVDISKYRKVKAFLKNKNNGHQPKKSKAFTREEVDTFLIDAPDNVYLMMKAVMVIGIAGACRKDELCNMTIDDIDDTSSVMIIRIPGATKKIERIFSIVDKEEGIVHRLGILRKYINVRPQNTEHRRFFMRYQEGKCINQVVGKNTFAKIPERIAKFLNLEDPTAYTGHCFRRTHAVLTNRGICWK